MREHGFDDACAMFHFLLPIDISKPVAVGGGPSSGADRQYETRRNDERGTKLLEVNLFAEALRTLDSHRGTDNF